ncbi:MAG TPA: ATP-dependent DNA helicase [Acidimicrobiia bacterium]|nr:ATP-dependent DNA helicase [Acidimicrobiia bacterium]
MTLTEVRVGPGDWAAAIADSEGPQLVVAGPGTGKTEFLVSRAVHLVESGKVSAEQIQILTFSRRAASEIGRRVNDSLSQANQVVPAATFHSFASRLLERHGSLAPGWSRNPSLLTGPEQIALVGELLNEEDPARWPLPHRPLLSTTTMAEEVADFILRARERLLDHDAIKALSESRPEWTAIGGFLERYDVELERRGRIDYGALLAAAITCLQHPQVADELADQIRYILVDEYQDTAPAQARLLELLAWPDGNLTAAADPYQSVYSFRGAELANVSEFGDRFGAYPLAPRRMVLTQSFRVPAQIMDAALRVVAGGDLPGAAGPVEPAPHQGRVEAYVFDQATAEAEWIASEVEQLAVGENMRWSDIAVLVRSTRHLLPELSRALERRRIPHDVPDRRLVDHPSVQIVFDLVQAAVSEASGGGDEGDRAMRRLLLGPLFALPLSAERRLFRTRLRQANKPWSAVLADLLPEAGILADLLRDPSWATSMPASHGFWQLWSQLPQLVPIVTDPATADYRAAFAGFSQVLERQEERDPKVTLADLRKSAEQEDFEATPLISLQRRPGDHLTLTTLHQAKGLEFEVVFIADAAEGSFPDLRRSRALLRPELLSLSYRQSDNPARLRLQEEMRLAYTAMTRARRRVIWTATSAAIDEGERRPSRFLLSAVGASTFDELGSPPRSPDRRPVTASEAQASLRRLLTEPGAVPWRRLAAVAVLAHPPRPIWDASCFAGVSEPGPDTGILHPPLTLSPSQADSYASCPRRYIFERRLQTSQQSGPYAEFGSLLHAVLEEVERDAVLQRRPTAGLERALEVLERVFAEEANFGSPVINQAWLRRGRQLLEQMYANWPGDDAIPLVLERHLELDLAGHHWSGFSDRIEQPRPGELRIVDYKTSKTAMPLEKAATSLQLGFYLLAVASDPELSAMGEPTEAELWYPLGGERRSFKRSELPSVARQLIDIGDSIASEDWTPTPGPACARCALRLVCPAWPEGREGFVA